MTDKLASYVLGKGRLYFPTMSATTLKETMEAPYKATAEITGNFYEHFVNAVLFPMRVMTIVGYNPQKLLPAPTFEREFMQSLTEWAAEQRKLAYTEFANSVFNTLTRDGEVTFSPTGRYVKDPEIRSAAYFLADKTTRIIDAMKPREAPVLVVGTDFSDVERKVLNYMHATFVHESAIGSPVPRGKIEIFHDIEAFRDYVRDHTGITDAMLDGSSMLKRKMPAREFATQHLKRSPSYLDHDPTKRHGRRKKK